MGDVRAAGLLPEQVMFHLEEYKATKAEILLILKLLYEGFIWCVATTAVAAGYVMYAVADPNLSKWQGLELAAFGPLVLTIILGAGFIHQGFALLAYSDYLDKLDALLAAQGHGLQSSVRLKQAKIFGSLLVGIAFLVLLVASWTFGWSVNSHLSGLRALAS